MNNITLAFFFILSFVTFGWGQRTLTPTELQEDFSQLQKELVKRNKGLYLFMTEQELEKRYNNYQQGLTTPKTELEFKQFLQQFITPIQERHLAVRGFHQKKSETGKRYKNGAVQLFPFAVKYTNDSTAFILRNASADSTFQVPIKLLSINGRTMADIRNEMEQYVMHDYGVTNRINYEISGLFASKYYEQMDTSSTFHLVCENYDKTIQQFDIEGVSNKEYSKKIEAHTKKIYNIEEKRPIFRTEYYDSLSTGYLKIGTFNRKKTKTTYQGEKITFKKTVDSFFETLEQKGYNNAIIDLRYNPGGSVSNMFHLLSYVQTVDKKHPIFQQTRKKYFSKETTTEIGKTKKPKQNHFDGNIYILTNAGSYSASVMFTSTLKTIRPEVTIVGEQAGGRYNGTTAGQFKIVHLRHSGIIVRIPERKYDYFVTDIKHIKPDIEVKPLLTDYFSLELDEVLRVTLQTIEKER